ncbi:multidrug effflux MFS transporter [Serratia symbiotica]|uniref:Bcr/CflA family efflux transporter n=1 Tax=Serratia symbiotica TaxID=138074 RepID=A0A068YXX4_9GAMM|nr:multidrug effflux MFS transporter [Serratia symbiotica]MBF1996146.1 multidrug effflux MFS transporter [Serratia symbiotica]MBQ0955287.1 multidrug effflux MFS transporter [Serratia symbiotica]QLH61641.1 multidrug effflux MFS transporter [Serratia symbiotica]QTP14632.1 multidrug effflux MFS transporter [Serratia symbiotica]CDS56468.1 Drug resistance transporter, Bcr/CflA family protein [Serratia symbiotica]
MEKTLTTPLVVLIVCLSVGGLISTDIFLPALGNMTDFYKVTEAQIQNAIAIFLFAVSFSQLIYGPLSDSLGRKKVLIAGGIIWLVSTVGVIYTTNINELLVFRLFQGIGSCAGITVSRAIINDMMDKKSSAQLYLVIFPFVGMSPAIAPMIGGVLTQYFGWHACFIFLTLFIILTLGLCFTSLKETLPPEKRHRLSISASVTNTCNVLLNKKFLYYAAIPCFAYATYFAYIVESPFILGKLGLSPVYVGYTYVLLSASYVAGNLTAKKISRKESVEATLRKGYIIFVLGGSIFAVQMYISPQPLISSVIAISILTFGNGFLLPLGTASAIAAHSQASGTASGLMGALQLGSAAFSSFLIGKVSAHNPEMTALIIAVAAVIGFVLYLLGQVRLVNYIENEESEIK